MTEEGLREVREEDLQGVRATLARHLPDSISVHGVVSLAVRYGLQTVKPATIFTPARSRPSSLTLVTNIMASTESFQNLSVFWSPEEEAGEDVATLLASLPAWDWSQPVYLYSCPETVLAALETLSIPGCQQLRVDRLYFSRIYAYDGPQFPIIQLPPGYHVTSLGDEDVDTVWMHWHYNRIQTQAAIKHLITDFPSIGVRRCDVIDMSDPSVPRESGTEDHRPLRGEACGTLVSWIHVKRNNSMGNTYTLPQHRRLGLAKAATAALTRRLLQEGQLPYVRIAHTNTASIKLHESLGFQRQCEMTNAFLMPPEDTPDKVFPQTYKEFLLQEYVDANKTKQEEA